MIVIAGTVRLRAVGLTAARPHMARMIAASRAEPGCLAYSYALDVLDETVVHVFEVWSDEAAFAAHIESAHITAWRAVWGDIGLSDRDLTKYEIGAHTPV